MPRGARKDVPITKLLFENGLLLDRRSFVGHGSDMVPHLFLRGQDKVDQRVRVFKFHKSKCSVCAFGGPLDWHHPSNCDCVQHSELRCNVFTGRPCHAHRTPGFRRIAEAQREAVKDFEKLYPKGEETCQSQPANQTEVTK